MKRVIDKVGFALLAIALLFAWVPSAEACPSGRALRGVGKGLKWLKNHTPIVRRLGR